MLDALRLDVRQAFRSLRRAPAFSLIDPVRWGPATVIGIAADGLDGLQFDGRVVVSGASRVEGRTRRSTA
jgi:hypothetical protein